MYIIIISNYSSIDLDNISITLAEDILQEDFKE